MKSRVSIAYSSDIDSAIAGALDKLEGLSELFIGRHVAVKPNETWASAEDTSACTQADTVRSLIRFIKGYYPKKITVSGGAGAGETEEVFRLLGIDKVIKEEGVEFFDHNRPPFTKVSLYHGPQSEVMVNERVLEYDTVISLAQHKVHHIADVTLAMKNIAMSFPAGDYYGHPRAKQLHAHRSFEDMHGFIAGMCQRFRPGLSVIVGHPAMTGTGPIGGHTFESGLVIASKDFVAADSVGAYILGREKVSHILQAESLGLGTADRYLIEMTGIQLGEALRIFNEKKAGKAA
ncbi:hypothetical protein BAC1_02158 [uncultured bacterium]|nr:hypothetical protein BAC1_02158 [uncultured bacterium]